jgi:REP element-mobilizing transposase RayT
VEDARLGEASLPKRKWLGHAVPSWVDVGIFFITINGRPRGGDELVRKPVADVIQNAALFYHASRWWIHLWLVMPDHVHALMSFPHRESMVKTVGDWKRYVSRKTGVEWQKGFFDHRLRREESFEEKARYIRMNPVRAGLVQSPQEWPYILAFDGRDGAPIPCGKGRDGSPSRPEIPGALVEDGRLGEASLPRDRA